MNAPERWRRISREVLRPSDPFDRHLQLFRETFRDWPAESGPAPAVLPEPDAAMRSNLGRWMSELGLGSYEAFHAFSVNNREEFLRAAVRRLGIRFRTPFERALDLSAGVRHPRWFPGATLNIVDSVFGGDADSTAILFRREGEPGLRRVSLAELDGLSARVANGLLQLGCRKGDAVAIDMPMTAECVAIYLGVVRAGMAVVSIADSFAAPEISTRLRIVETRAAFTQDAILRDGKTLPLYEKLKAANAPACIVVPAEGSTTVALRKTDTLFDDFLSPDSSFDNVAGEPSDTIDILFSSGTTGEPKAIPWTQTTPLRCALDGHVHQDLQHGDVVAWPTNVGWMMGPWLIFASLLNRAAIALYDGSPGGRGFCEFVRDAGVTVLGVVPSLVRTWRSTDCTAGLDWSRIKLFTSTGEASSAEDMLWLMSRAGYKPVIEYCGGTEIGGGYITSTVLQPNSPSCFSAKAVGTDFVILEGELFLVPPSLGLSDRLLNADHDDVYYADCPPGPDGQQLRRHGDRMQALPGGFYRALGRADDTMNLGGIKVAAVELERVMNRVYGVVETAAVAVPPEGGGPDRLVVHAVVDRAVWSDASMLKKELQTRLRTELNPLFRIHKLHLAESLPRTASNKVMRRLLRIEQIG